MEEKLLVLLVGQSNMSGRGYLTDEDIFEIPGLSAIRRDFQWIPAVDPFNFDRLNLLGLSESADPFEVRGLTLCGKQRCGVGPGRTFGRLMLEKFPGKEVGLIPASIGGTAVAAWLPGGKDRWSEAHPYDDSIILAKEALKCGKIVAVLWHQGESDAAENTPDYKEKLKTVIANFRRELNIPDVPFILGGLGTFLNPAWPTADFNRMIEEAAAETPHCGFVSAEGLTDRGDHLHFDTESQHELGRRYWEEYCKVAGIKEDSDE